MDDGGRDHATLKAEEDVPGQVLSGERRGGVVFHEDQIGVTARDDLSERSLGEEGVGKGGIVVDRHLDHVTAVHAARIAVFVLMQQGSSLPLIPHRMGKAVVAKTNTHAHAEHGFDLRHADTVVHVRARLMRDPGSRLGQLFQLVLVHVDGMRHNGALSEDAMFVEPVHRPGGAEVVLEHGVAIVLRLTHVDVEARPVGGGGAGFLQDGGRKRERGVQAEGSSQERTLCPFEEPHVFVYSRAGFALSIAAADLVAQHGAQARLFDGFGDDVERAVDEVGRSVVIKECGGAMLDGVHQTGQGRIADAVLVQ